MKTFQGISRLERASAYPLLLTLCVILGGPLHLSLPFARSVVNGARLDRVANAMSSAMSNKRVTRRAMGSEVGTGDDSATRLAVLASDGPNPRGNWKDET
jgi:hypothetical protein